MLCLRDLYWDALRALYGQTALHTVTHLEIGNKDSLSGGCATYASRFTQFHIAMHAAYSSITTIASTTDSSCLPNPVPFGIWTDIHHFEELAEFISL